MTSIEDFQGILSSNPVTTDFPASCQNLAIKYDGIDTSFTAFNVCIIYPDLILGLAGNSFDQSFVTELSNYGIEPVEDADRISQDITNQTIEFLMEACGNINCNNRLSEENNSTCNDAFMRRDDQPALDLQGVYSCRDAICRNLQTYVKDDPDIGGVGVFISYILQIFLVLLMSVYILWKYIVHERRVDPDDIHSPFVGSVAFPEALKDFQKLQSWFIGSLVIAAFIRQYQEITNISVTDFLFLGGISLNGVVLICYMNAALLLLGRKSWYVFGLSCITFAMCSAFLLYANFHRVERVDDVLPALSFCQPQLSILKYSDEITDWVRLVSKLPQATIWIAWGFCAAVQLGCIFWMFELEEALPHGFKKWSNTFAGKAFLWIITFFILLAFFAIFGLQMVMLYRFWGIVDPSLWSFGQIIAVTIWLPIVIDYLHGRYKERQKQASLEYTQSDATGYSAVPLMATPNTWQQHGGGPGTPGFAGWTTPNTFSMTSQPYDTYPVQRPHGSQAPPLQQAQLPIQYGFVAPTSQSQNIPIQSASGYNINQPTSTPINFQTQAPPNANNPIPPRTSIGSIRISNSPDSSGPIPVPLQTPPPQTMLPAHSSPHHGRTTPQNFGSSPSHHHIDNQDSDLIPMQQYPIPGRPPVPPSAWGHNTDYFGTSNQPLRRREVGSRRSSGASEHSRSGNGSGFGPV